LLDHHHRVQAALLLGFQYRLEVCRLLAYGLFLVGRVVRDEETLAKVVCRIIFVELGKIGAVLKWPAPGKLVQHFVTGSRLFAERGELIWRREWAEAMRVG
jgi:hypothetical protein